MIVKYTQTPLHASFKFNSDARKRIDTGPHRNWNKIIQMANYGNSTYRYMFVTSLRVLRHCILIGVAIEPSIADPATSMQNCFVYTWVCFLVSMIESLSFLLHFPMKVQRIIGIQLSSIFIIIRNSGNTNRVSIYFAFSKLLFYVIYVSHVCLHVCLHCTYSCLMHPLNNSTGFRYLC